MLNRRTSVAGTVAFTGAPIVGASALAKAEIAISRQPGILYMPTHVIEQQWGAVPVRSLHPRLGPT